MKQRFTIAFIIITACGTPTRDAKAPQAQPQEEDAQAKKPRKKPVAAVNPPLDTGDKTSGDPVPGEDSESESESEQETESDGENGELPNRSDLAEGKKYFEETIFPLFTATCASCHADPRMNPPQRGPLTIFSYDTMRTHLTDGTSSTDNRLLRKVRNIDPHGGGNRCTAGATGSPCQEVMEWWRLELGPDSGIDGRIISISVSGDVVGYAVDTRDETLKVKVRLFVDQNLAVETTADLAGSDGNYAGDHAFRVQLPASVRDGKERTITAFVDNVPLGSSLKYVAYAPKEAGKTYFANTVAPALTGRCAGCHVIQYDVQYGSLISPSPNKGGTALANALIDHSAGANNHPGGNICGNKNATPCNLLQTWWNLEFGP